MKKIFLFTSLILIVACQETPPPTASPTEETMEEPADTYDAALAKELGADEYGMRKYVMAFLKAGPNRSQDSLEAAQLQKAHLENIGRMAEEGQLSIAGPFMDDGDIRGIYIFNVETLEEARMLTETDPAIQAGRLEMELHPWYGPAGLMKVLEINKKLTQKSVTD